MKLSTLSIGLVSFIVSSACDSNLATSGGPEVVKGSLATCDGLHAEALEATPTELGAVVERYVVAHCDGSLLADLQGELDAVDMSFESDVEIAALRRATAVLVAAGPSLVPITSATPVARQKLNYRWSCWGCTARCSVVETGTVVANGACNGQVMPTCCPGIGDPKE